MCPEPDVIARLDAMVDDAAKRYNLARNKLRESTGDRPWGSRVLSSQEKLDRFADIWEDDAIWTQAVERERLIYNLPPESYPKRLIKETLELVRALQERG